MKALKIELVKEIVLASMIFLLMSTLLKGVML